MDVRDGPLRKLSMEELMLLNCGVGEDSWESPGLKGDQTSIQEISPEYSLKGLMLKLKLQYFGHLMQRTHSLEKTPMLGKIESRRRREWQRMRWLDAIIELMDMSKLQELAMGQGNLAGCCQWGHKESDMTEWLNWSDVPTTDAQETEVDQFYEDLQILLEVTPKKICIMISFAS